MRGEFTSISERPLHLWGAGSYKYGEVILVPEPVRRRGEAGGGGGSGQPKGFWTGAPANRLAI